MIDWTKPIRQESDQLEKSPWLTEPDRELFNSHGFNCELWRHPSMLHWCGYVYLPPDHPQWGKDYDELNHTINVHGGLTYSGKEEEFWKVGFDCAHAKDLIPGGFHYKNDIYRTIEFARLETILLAEQFRKNAND